MLEPESTLNTEKPGAFHWKLHETSCLHLVVAWVKADLFLEVDVFCQWHYVPDHIHPFQHMKSIFWMMVWWCFSDTPYISGPRKRLLSLNKAKIKVVFTPGFSLTDSPWAWSSQGLKLKEEEVEDEEGTEMADEESDDSRGNRMETWIGVAWRAGVVWGAGTGRRWWGEIENSPSWKRTKLKEEVNQKVQQHTITPSLWRNLNNVSFSN